VAKRPKLDDFYLNNRGKAVLLKNYNKQLLYIEGGIGDFLQNIPFIAANKQHNIRYLVAVHFKGAYDLFELLGIKPEKFIYFETIEEKNRLLNGLNYGETIFKCPRAYFFEQPPFDE
jgi:hypothetical protein